MIFKKIILATLLISTFLSAEIKWNDYKTTFFKAEKSELKKDVFVFVVSENCGYCHKMMKQINKDSKFQNTIKEKYHTVLINRSKDFIPIEIDNGVTPSFFILDKDTLSVKGGPFVGYMPTRTLLDKVTRIR